MTDNDRIVCQVLEQQLSLRLREGCRDVLLHLLPAPLRGLLYIALRSSAAGYARLWGHQQGDRPPYCPFGASGPFAGAGHGQTAAVVPSFSCRQDRKARGFIYFSGTGLNCCRDALILQRRMAGGTQVPPRFPRPRAGIADGSMKTRRSRS